MTILDNFDKAVYENSGQVQVANGTAAFTYKVPKDQKGGEYKIKVESNNFATVFRKFRIN